MKSKTSNKREKIYHFRLYVSGVTNRSTKAITNLKTICDAHLAGRYELEVIDIYKQPDKAYTEQIVAAPTLVKQLPAPLRRFIGDLSDTQRLLAGLEIHHRDASQTNPQQTTITQAGGA